MPQNYAEDETEGLECNMKLLKTETWAQWKKIYQLYQEAFPDYEKKPFWLIWLKNKQGRADVWYIVEEGAFIGLGITMSAPGRVLLDYFAIESSMREKGYGSKALKALQEQYADQHFFLEIESVYDDCDNVEQRLRRKQFYLRNGMTEMKMMVHLFGTDMEVLGHGCQLDFESYAAVYESTYGARIRKNVKHVQYPQV